MKAAASALVLLVGCSGGGARSDAGADVATRDGGGDARHDSDAGPPELVALRVLGAIQGLTPRFSPSTHDYYVGCAAGDNALTVSVTASEGATAAVTQPTRSPSGTTETVAVSVPEGGAIVATASNGGVSTEYWVRCLPHDFPSLTFTAYPDAGARQAGYYLVGNAVVPSGQSGYAIVLDSNGVPVWYQAAQGDLVAVSDVGNVVPGVVSYVPTSFDGYLPFTLDQLSPFSSTTLAPQGYASDEHELQALPNGYFLTFSYTLKGGVDLTGLEIPLPDDGGTVPLGPNSTIQDCTVLEIDSTGAVAWSWSASEHLDPAKVSTYPQTGFGPDAILPDGGTTYDVFHCTAIDVDPANGNLLVSSRGTDSAWYIDRSTSKILWKIGGVDATLDGATYVSLDDPFHQEHDGRLLGWNQGCSGGSGQVSFFDDQTNGPLPARGVIYDVVVGGDAGCPGGPSLDGSAPPAGQARVAWQYKGTTGSGGAGSMRINPDGTRILGWGIGTPVFTEVTEGGQVLDELTFGTGDVSYRALKVPLTAFDLAALRSTSGR